MPTEKLLTIPLRGQWLKKARVSRTQRSIKEVKYYLYKHMKATDVKMSELLNEAMWKGGAKRPPHTIKVKASKDEKGIVTVILPEEKIVVEEKKGVAAKLLRRKGKVVKKIVLDKPKEKPEVDSKGTKLTNQLPTETQLPSKIEPSKPAAPEHKHEHKPGDEHAHKEEKPSEAPKPETKESPKPEEEKSKAKK